MTPRPRKATDEAIFEAILRLMGRVEPEDLTLAAVGAEAGITAGALVQRFGSKQGMMRALNARFAGGTEAMLSAQRAAHASPLDAVRAFVVGFADMAVSPAALAHHLAYFRMDLSDEQMFEEVRAHTRSVRTALRDWLAEAVTAGELRQRTDPGELARVVHATAIGSMMSYVFFEEGDPAEWLTRDLNLALQPHRPDAST